MTDNKREEAKTFTDWFNRQVYGLGSIPSFFQQGEMERAFDAGKRAGVASIDRVQVVGVDKSAVLVMIQAAKQGDWQKFDSYARFGAEKTGNERFIKAVDKYLKGEYGVEVEAMEVKND